MAVEPLPHLTPYRQLLAVAELRALLLATLLSRLAGRMFALAIVLYGVTQVHSPVLAGWLASPPLHLVWSSVRSRDR
jgi:hypothetical protein